MASKGNLTPGLMMIEAGKVGPGKEFDFETDSPTPPGMIVRNPENNKVRFDSMTIKVM